MLVPVAPVAQPLRQVLWQQPGKDLQRLVGKVCGQEGQFFRQPVHPCLEGKQRRQPVCAQLFDHPEGVLAINSSNIEGVAMNVFAGNG